MKAKVFWDTTKHGDLFVALYTNDPNSLDGLRIYDVGTAKYFIQELTAFVEGVESKYGKED